MTLFFFVVQVVTGILLMLYYRPSAEAAFESVEFIMTTVPFGWLVRSIHSWSANLMVFFAVLHLVSVYFLKAYRRPRELTWVTRLPAAVPGHGLRLLRLPAALEPARLLRDQGRHRHRRRACPSSATGCCASCAAASASPAARSRASTAGTWRSCPRSRRALAGRAPAAGAAPRHERAAVGRARRRRRRAAMRFFPHFALRELFGWTLALGVLAALAALFPWELGEKADPFAPGLRGHPARVVLHVHVPDAEARAGRRDRGHRVRGDPDPAASACAGALLVLVPFLDRGRGAGTAARLHLRSASSPSRTSWA